MKLIVFNLLLLTSVVAFAQESEIDQYKVYQQKGRELILQGKYDSAIFMLDTGLVRMPYSHSMYYERGYSYMQLQKYDDAISNFSQLIEKADYKYSAYLNRGICYFEKNDLKQAKLDFKKTLELDPDNSTALKFLAETENALSYTSQSNIQNEQFITRQRELEREIIDQRRNQEAIFWGTVIPIVFWSTVFLTW